MIAVGQFTLCYNLLMKVNDRLAEPGDHKEVLLTLTDQLQFDFKRFQSDPYWLYQDIKPATST